MRVFQYLVFIALICVSAFFTINLALGLGTTPVEKAALVAGSLALEGLKAFALVSANTAIRRRHWAKGTSHYLIYVFVAAYSLISCFGYALSTVDRMESSTRVVDHQAAIAAERTAAEEYGEQIRLLRAQIDQRQAALTQMDPIKQAWLAFQTRKVISESMARVDGYLGRQRQALERVDEWRSQDQVALTGRRRSLYDVIGGVLGIPGSRVAFFVLAMFSLAIELGVFLTSPHAGGNSHESRPAVARNRGDRRVLHPLRRILGLLVPSIPTGNPIQARVRERQPCRSPTTISATR